MAQIDGEINFARLESGDWGLGVRGELTPGERVTVTKKSGEEKIETVGAFVMTKENGISLYTIGKPVREDLSIPPADDEDVPF